MAGLVKRLTVTSRLNAPYFGPIKHQTRNHKVLCTRLSYSLHLCYTPPYCNLHPKSCIFSFQRKYVPSSQIVPFKLSDIGEGIREVAVKEWFVKVGDKVSQFDNICEVQSDKASVTITSRYDGIIKKLHYNIDDIALVGEPLVDLEIIEDCSLAKNTKTNSLEGEREDMMGDASRGDKILTTPAVRRFAKEKQVDLHLVTGTGKHGRVLKEDILVYLEGNRAEQIPSESAKILLPRIPNLSTHASGLDHIEPIRGFAKTMVKTMTAANMIPHFVYSDEVDISKLADLVAELKKEQSEVKFTYMSFFIKAVSKCLLKYPILNSSVDDKSENVIYKSSHNIGVAMDTPSGLVVPNIKNVQHLDILKIALDLSRLHASGLTGTLQPSDLIGGTFTLSNIGSIGGTYTKPVILPPEVAIGAVGSAQLLPRFDETGNIVKKKIVCISWAADHRIIDGATMARFSNLWKNYILHPYKLILNL